MFSMHDTNLGGRLIEFQDVRQHTVIMPKHYTLCLTDEPVQKITSSINKSDCFFLKLHIWIQYKGTKFSLDYAISTIKVFNIWKRF